MLETELRTQPKAQLETSWNPRGQTKRLIRKRQTGKSRTA